jgi:hypothetical protein
MGEGRIEPRPGLEGFINQGGNISIQQIDRDEEAIVVVHPEDVPKLIELLHRAHQDALNLEPLENEQE